MADLANAAGTSWKLTPHQTRRTYARLFVESRMGRTSLIFLKEQFKHSSMSMIQLYASNPQQDRALFDDILSELTAYKGVGPAVQQRARRDAERSATVLADLGIAPPKDEPA